VVQKELMKNRIIYLSCKTVVHVLEKSVAHILRRIGKKWPHLRNIYNNVCRIFYMRSMDRMKVKVTQSFLGFFSAKWRGQHGLHPLYYILWISMTLKEKGTQRCPNSKNIKNVPLDGPMWLKQSNIQLKQMLAANFVISYI